MEHGRLAPRHAQLIIGSLILTATVALVAAFPAATLAAPFTPATVQFGNPNAPSTEQNCDQGGAGIPPEPCAHAANKLIPGAVAISAP